MNENKKEKKLPDKDYYRKAEKKDVIKRFCEFLKELESKPLQNVAAFCHAGLITIVTGYILSANLDRDAIHCPNCNIVVLEFDGNKWRLLVWNYGAEIGIGTE